MSLVAFALRACVQRVAAAALGASFTVLDSPVDAISALIDSRAPSGAYRGVVAVYAGHGVNKWAADDANDPGPGGVFAGNPRIDLFMQILLPSQIAVTTDAGVTAQVNARNAGAELALDIVTRAILRGLSLQASGWGQLFGRAVSRIDEVDWGSYLVETTSVKTPGRELRLSCVALQEPVPGAALTPFWADFLAAVQADAEFAPLAPLLEAELSSPSGLSQGEIDRIFLGITETAAQDVGITATTVDPNYNPPLPAAEAADTISAGVADLLAGNLPS